MRNLKAGYKKLIANLAGLPLSYKAKNDIIRAGTTAIRWAYNNELIDKDPTQGIIFFSGTTTPREILTSEIVQALQLRSLGENCLYIKHSWNFQDGLKCPKNRESRTVLYFGEQSQQIPWITSVGLRNCTGHCNQSAWTKAACMHIPGKTDSTGGWRRSTEGSAIYRQSPGAHC